MPYLLAIDPEAEREWFKLDESIRSRFKQKLAKERLIQPRNPKDAIKGRGDHYKIKLTSPQYRLIYHVDDVAQKVTIMGVSSRDFVYDILNSRLKK
jgi:mRNA interferase RelE/StbE